MKQFQFLSTILMIAVFTFTSCTKDYPDRELAVKHVKATLHTDNVEIQATGVTESGDPYYRFKSGVTDGYIIDTGESYSVVNMKLQSVYELDKESGIVDYHNAEVRQFLIHEYGHEAENYTIIYKGITPASYNYWEFNGNNNGYVIQTEAGFVIEDDVDGI